VNAIIFLPIPSTECSDRYGNGSTLAGVIYIHRISDKRFTGITKRNFGMLRELCGDKTLKNVILVTNMWGEVSLEVGEAREEELVGEFFKPVLDKGAQIARHHDTVKSAHDIIRRIMKNQPIALQIQRELVDEHKNITETAAGQAARRDLNEQIKHHKAELKAIQEEMLRAQRKRDEETKRELEEEMCKIQKEMNRMKMSLEGMAAGYVEEKKRTEEVMRQVREQARQDREWVEQRRRMDELNECNEEKRRMEEGMRQMQEQARQEREQAAAEHQILADELKECNEERRRMEEVIEEVRQERKRVAAEHQILVDELNECNEGKRRMEEGMRQMQEQARQEREQAAAEHQILADKLKEHNEEWRRMEEVMKQMQVEICQEREQAAAEHQILVNKLNKCNEEKKEAVGGMRERYDEENRRWVETEFQRFVASAERDAYKQLWETHLNHRCFDL
jgi:chromosome segregation ATPase